MNLLTNPTMDETEDEVTDGRVGTCQLTMERRADIVALLLWGAIGFTISRGAFASIAKEALCSEKAVQNIWMQLKGGEHASEIIIGEKTGIKTQSSMTQILSSKKLETYLCITTGLFAIFPWQLVCHNPQFIGLC